jgi:hypothetical protein
MPSRRTVRTVTTSYDDSEAPARRTVRHEEYGDDIPLSRDTLVRRQDQRIKDDITSKLYRVEMDRVKPSFDVQLATSNFRTVVPRRQTRRHISPEPGLKIVTRTSSVDPRRYSTAGNLEIYRPKTQTNRYGFEKPAAENALVVYQHTSAAPTLPFNWRAHESAKTNDLLNEHELRKIAELRVRGRSNGPLPRLTYLPLTRRESSSPPDVYRYSTVEHRSPVYGHRVASAGTGRKVSDGQYELDQFEKLMKRNFGAGGVNRDKTLMYTAPPYRSYYEPYRSYYEPYYNSTYQYSTPPSSYSRAYYGDTYSSPSYYYQPYYASSYYPYSYVDVRPTQYEYPIYSPPTRVTAPGTTYGYYGGDYYGRLPYGYSSYRYVR